MNAQTGLPDGSVRGNDWEAAIPATDTTERKAVTISYYESWDFDAAGKIWLTQTTATRRGHAGAQWLVIETLDTKKAGLGPPFSFRLFAIRNGAHSDGHRAWGH